MGRGSDTRMYNPRSESSHMFRENHEEEGTRTGYEDPRDLDSRADKRQAKKEKEDKEDRKIKHIKVRRHHLRSGQDEIDEEEGRDDSTKLDADREVGLQTNPAGTGGFLTSLATQAKGPGAAAGQLVAMSEPMENAWSELLKSSVIDDRLPEDTQIHELGHTDLVRLLSHPNERIAAFAERELNLREIESHGSVPMDSASEKEIAEFYEPQFQSLPYDYGNVQPSDVKAGRFPDHAYHQERSEDVIEAIPGKTGQLLPSAREKYDHLKETAPQHLVDDYVQQINDYYQDMTNPTYLPFFDLESPARYISSQIPESTEDMMNEVDISMQKDPRIIPGSLVGGATGFDHGFQQKNASEPMDYAWSELLKSKKEERKRKKEMSAHWRPSTGAFELPKGGSNPGSATSRRAKIISRNLPEGKKTGLGQAHLSVEMSHRGIASKQPKSKDPAEYTKFLAQQEARRRIGNVRTPYSQPRRFGQPSKRGFRLNMPRAPRPRLHPVRTPRITPPKMKVPHLNKPKMPGMVTMSEDEVTHSDVLKSASDAGYLRILVRELREALRDARDKDKKSKGMGTPDTSGAGSNLPNHPSNSHAQTSAPQGGTENEEAEAQMYGADPAQVINARGSNKS